MANSARLYNRNYKHIEVTPLGGTLGGQIEGVDLRKDLDEFTFNEIRTALFDHEVIVFRDQDITTEQQKTFGIRFGDLSIHPFSPNRADNPEVIILDYHKDNPPALTDQWHSDETFRECPPFGTILRAHVVPEAGGDTLFASMTAAYDGLSERMQAHVEGLVAEHDFLPWRPLFGNDPDSKARLRELEDEFPKRWHPVVRVHPATEKKLLYVSPQFVTRIVGLSNEESSTILNFLYAQARVPENQLRVKWEKHTIVMWDNTSVQHYAAHDYYPQNRSMERITIKGDKPVGPIDESLLPTQKMIGASDTVDKGQKSAAVRQFERK